jgi:hypothetical protein
MKKIIFLQLNELNFEYVARYAQSNDLPNFKNFFDKHGYVITNSENKHELAQPWVQWPTVHTGLDFAEHGIYRLGDIAKKDHPHIYEILEQRGLKVAAMSPFNAKNNTKNAAFFVPDPWTKTKFTGSKSLEAIYDAIAQVTDDYASDKITPKSIMLLVFGALDNIQWKNIPHYIKETLVYLLQNKKWYRALVCDRLLSDTFLTQWHRHQPDFSTLLLNGSAHLQHHYLFSSKVYEGSQQNPEWVIAKGEDPLLDILKVYDQILGDLIKAVGSDRLIIATGLHQEAHERTTYYYRFNDQIKFLDQIGIQYTESYRLMTEDFVIVFQDKNEALMAERTLAQVQTVDTDDIFYIETGDCEIRTLNTSNKIFHIENRGKDLYIQLKPVKCEFPKNISIRSGDKIIENFDQLISFAQYKNTHHHGVGYFADSSLSKNTIPKSIPLKNIFSIILNAFDDEQDLQPTKNELSKLNLLPRSGDDRKCAV